MKNLLHPIVLALGIALLGTTAERALARPAPVTFQFLGVAAGDAGTGSAVLWTRGVDTNAPAATSVTVQVSSDNFMTTAFTASANTDPAADYTVKFAATGLQPATVYNYRFTAAGATSITGRFKTAPLANVGAPLHFAFSGDMDGLIRPYALASNLPSENLDFYVNLGDVIYENASNVKGNINQPYTNSPSVTLSGDSASLNGVPTGGTTFATQAQLKADYQKKYRENFLPVNAGGQLSLLPLYAAQGNYTTWDNHELGNRQYINGGAPAGGSVGGASGNDMPTGRGVDARDNGTGNVANVNDTDVTRSAGDYMNRSVGFQTLRDVFLSYQPITTRPTLSTPSDARTDGSVQLYTAQQWGSNALYINTDCRSYRDLRLKTAPPSGSTADDTSSPRADNPNRTFLGQTQLAWLENALLNAQNAGVTWKFVSVSDPIDQIGPIGGALTLNNLPSFGAGSTYAAVNSDGGKAWIGGYRAERNALLKFIADHQIKNVVFLATDDHQNRINELTYSPTGQFAVQSSYIKVPYCFSIVCGPLGATGPDLILNHTFQMALQLANSIANAQQLAGVETIGLAGYPGLKNVAREFDPLAGVSPAPVDFYSPDTFNYNVFDVSADGKTLTVSSVGITATAQNSALEYDPVGNPARTIFTFQIDAPAAPVIKLGGFSYDRRTGKMAQLVTVTNPGSVPLTGPVNVVLDGISGNTSLTNPTGNTVNNAPTGSPYVVVTSGTIAPGASVSASLLFTKPASGAITYTARTVTGTSNP